jgi:hypothetical protein
MAKQMLNVSDSSCAPQIFLFVAMAWGVPLVLSIVAGSAFGSVSDGPYLCDLVVWSRSLSPLACSC